MKQQQNTELQTIVCQCGKCWWCRNRNLGFKSLLPHSLAMWPRPSQRTFLNFNFLFDKVRILTVSTSLNNLYHVVIKPDVDNVVTVWNAGTDPKLVLLCASSSDLGRSENSEMLHLIMSCFLLLFFTGSQTNSVPRVTGKTLSVGIVPCWRRSHWGRDHQLTRELDLGRLRLLTPSSILGMSLLPVSPTVGNVPRT